MKGAAVQHAAAVPPLSPRRSRSASAGVGRGHVGSGPGRGRAVWGSVLLVGALPCRPEGGPGASQCGRGTGGAVTTQLPPSTPRGRREVPCPEGAGASGLLPVADSAAAAAPLPWLALVLLGLGAVTPMAAGMLALTADREARERSPPLSTSLRIRTRHRPILQVRLRETEGRPRPEPLCSLPPPAGG